MSINRQDWISWLIDASLTLAGVTYACDTLAKQIALNKTPRLHQIRSFVPRISVELAFRRWLDKENLPYLLHEDQPFSNPARPSIFLGGHRVVIHGVHISSRRQISRILYNPDILHSTKIKLSGKRSRSTPATCRDLIVFAIYLGFAPHTTSNLQKVLSREQPVFPIAVPKDKEWINSTHTSSLGKLMIAVENHEGMVLELAGCTKTRPRFKEIITLDGQTAETSQEMTSLFYIHPERLPSSDLQIYSPVLNIRWNIQPSAWVNLWIDGIRLYFLGWSTWQKPHSPLSLISDFGQHHSLRHRYKKQCTTQYAALRPMRELIQYIRQS